MSDSVDTIQESDNDNAEANMEPDAVQPNTAERVKSSGKLGDADIADAKADYMSGRYDTLDLSNKYHTSRICFFKLVKPNHPNSEGWLGQALRAGISPKQEAPYTLKRVSEETWHAIKKDLLLGLTQAECMRKYGVDEARICQTIIRLKWRGEIARAKAKRQRDQDREIHKLIETADKEAEEPAEEVDDTDSDDISGQMREFVKAASIQLKMITGEIRASNKRKEKIAPSKFEDLIDKFSKMADAVKKMKAASSLENGGSGGSGRLIRPGVMEQAVVKGTDMAPTIS